MKKLMLTMILMLFMLSMLAASTDMVIHYHRYDGNYEGWDLWLWGPGLNGSAYEFDSEDDYGKVAHCTIHEDLDEVGFLVRLGNWAAKDVAQDRYVTTDDEVTEIWLLQGVKEIFFEEPDTSPRIFFAGAIDDTRIRAFATNPFDTNAWEGTVKLTVNGVEKSIKTVQKVDPTDISITNFFEIQLEEPLTLGEISSDVFINLQGYAPQRVIMMGILDKHYSEKHLGMIYSQERTTFRVWSPPSTSVKLLLYEDPESETPIEVVEMTVDESGVWETTMMGDLRGHYYLYEYTHYGQTVQGVDPYSLSTYANGTKSAVIDLEKTNPNGWHADTYKTMEAPEDAILYEIHVADMTGGEDSGVSPALKNTYKGLFERGTRTAEGIKTGFDHILDLGITHVHILPIYDFYTGDELNKDFEDYYNWGYDPYLFTVPEGRYASDPRNPMARISEVKQMVKSFHENDMGVIMDMVFPHTYGLDELSPFDTAVPYYYYKISKTGDFINESGCGNTIASHRPMMRSYIVDTLTYWVKEYHIDGFRFDQMGFIDVQTLKEAAESIYNINPSALLYGEGWGDPLAADYWMTPDEGKYYAQISRMVQSAVSGTSIGTFNDDIRDGIRGSVFETSQKGFVLDSFPKFKDIQRGIVGGVQYSDKLFWLLDDPQQSINYAACHDNHTLWDKNSMAAAVDSRFQWSTKMLKDAQKLAGAILLTSQGVPFLHAGQEFCRTKGNDGNSYNSPISVNALDYERKAEFMDVYNYYKGLIELRKEHPAFRMRTQEQIQEAIEILSYKNKRVVPFSIDGTKTGDTWENIFVIFNGGRDNFEYELPEGEWNVVVDAESAGTSTLYTLSGTITLKPTSALVLYQ
ncbi:MAG: type I pullulanase [Thermotogota bacterium]